MGFFTKLLGLEGHDSEEDKLAMLSVMEEMADEAERVHRNRVEVFSEEFSEATPTGRGLYMARLRAAVMPVWAYGQLRGDVDAGMELMDVATGLALEPLEGEGPDSFSREEALEMDVDYLMRVFQATDKCMREGASLPGQEKPGFQALAELIHECLAESIGREKYTEPVRERFDMMVKTGMTEDLRYIGEMIGQERRIS